MTVGEAVSIGLGFLAIVAPDFWPKMPRALSYALAGIGLCWLTYSGILATEGQTGMKLEHGPLAAIIIGAAFIGGGIFWHISRLQVHPTPPVATNISVDCHSEILPKTFGPYDTVRTLQLFPLRPENGGGGLANFFNRSGKEWKWPGIDTAFPLDGYRCEITNYDTVPVSDFMMLLDLTFFEAVDVPNQPNAKGHGTVKLKRDWRIDVPKIDVGSANSFVFYIFNNELDQFVHVLIPKTAMMRRLGETEPRVIGLTVPNIGGKIPLMFGPRFDVSNQK